MARQITINGLVQKNSLNDNDLFVIWNTEQYIDNRVRTSNIKYEDLKSYFPNYPDNIEARLSAIESILNEQNLQELRRRKAEAAETSEVNSAIVGFSFVGEEETPSNNNNNNNR